MLVAPSCFPVKLRHCYSMRISCSAGFVFPTSDLLHLSGLGSSACPLIKNTTTELPIEGDALACPLPTHKKRMQLVRAALNAGALYAVHGPPLSWTPGMRSCDFYIEVHTYMHGMNGVSLQNSRLASPGLCDLMPKRDWGGGWYRAPHFFLSVSTRFYFHFPLKVATGIKNTGILTLEEDFFSAY